MRLKTFLLLLAFSCILGHAYVTYHYTRLSYPVESFGYCDMPLLSLDVPDSGQSHLTPLHKPVEGTDIALVVPDSYQPTVAEGLFYRDQDTSIEIQQTSESFYTSRSEMNQYLTAPADESSRYLSVRYHKNFKFNNYDAMLVCVSDQLRQRTSVYMSYGDATFHVRMRGICRTGDMAAIHEIVSTFLTSYHS